MRRLVRLLTAVLLCSLFLSASASAAFPDVPPQNWYAEAVSQMAATGLLSDGSDGRFRPDATISAAEFISIAARSAGLSPKRGQAAHWASGWAQAALEAGWYDWDELAPTGERFNEPIPRQLAVKILMRALLPEARGDYLTESQKISDFSLLNGRYYDSVLAAYASGVVSGDANGCFRPLGSLSRAEASVLVYTALQKTQGGAAMVSSTATRPVTAPQPSATPLKPSQPAVSHSGGVRENGWLQVCGTQLCNASGEPVVLRGMSTHGLQWYGNFANTQSIRNLSSFGANLFRVAMYTGENGYLSQPDAMRQQAMNAIDAAIAEDLYVILDWHILSDGNPMSHVEEAAVFFSEMARRYQDCPAVIYEICNEPNGNTSWSGDVKPYAERIVSCIRAQSPQAVILIGSPTWSQDIHLAAADPVAGENLMYTLHFYAGAHGAELRERIDKALANGLPVFVSEWGASRADGSGGVFLEQAGEWLDFLRVRGISWANWSLCDKSETSAALKPGTPTDRAWTQADLSASRQFVFSRFRDG